MNKTLIIGELPTNYSKNIHKVLGPWKLRNNQELLFDDRIFELDPYETASDIRIDADSAVQFSEYLIQKYLTHFNKLNNTNYSIKFWKIFQIVNTKIIWLELVKKYKMYSFFKKTLIKEFQCSVSSV